MRSIELKTPLKVQAKDGFEVVGAGEVVEVGDADAEALIACGAGIAADRPAPAKEPKQQAKGPKS